MSGIADLIRRWPEAAQRRLLEQPRLCEDCGNGTDLGHKCRACYAQWSRLVWQDIPAQHRELTRVSSMLNEASEGERRIVADLVLGHPVKNKVSGRTAELVTLVRRVTDGPYGPQMTSCLQAIRSAATDPKKNRRASGSEVD